MEKWKIDPVHSEVKFKVKHLVVSTVTGQFRKFSAEAETENDKFENAKILFEADIDSIDTREPQRDAHLKSADFFDAARYQKMTFVSKSFKRKSDSRFELVGDLTIRGVKKEVKLDVAYNGKVKGIHGNDVAGFEVTGKLNRQDFGLKWNVLTEAGGIVVGDEVRLEIELEMQKEKVEAETAHA
jgi:polyisoprenoid-binding protein YceI